MSGRPRKPSVAASRRFSCADSFALPSGGAKQKRTQIPDNPKPKIFLNGRNVTPLPLNKTDELCSIEEIGFLRPDAPRDGISVPEGTKRPLAWPAEEPDLDWSKEGNEEEDAGDEAFQTKPNLFEQCRTAQTRNTGNAVKESNSPSNTNSAKDCKPQNQNSFTVGLTESQTTFLLSIPGSAVANNAPEFEEVKDRNAAFEKAKSKKMENTGRFKERAAQTFHSTQRTVALMATAPETSNCGVGFSPHDFKESEPALNHDSSFVESFTAALVAPSGCLLDVSDGAPSSNPVGKGKCLSTVPESIQHVLDEWSKSIILSSPGLAKAARTMELAIQQTSNGDRELQYLGVPKGCDSPEAETDALQTKKLFVFCSSSCERPATAFCWHKANPHNLAVGYGGDSSSAEDSSGMIMLWSLRNFDYPETLLSTSSEVCSLDYSASRPSLIAAGLSDGRILLYDTSRNRENIGTPVAESTFLPGRHMQPIHAIKWMMNTGRYERLITCSSDGKVIQWSFHKGLSLTPLMTLDRSRSASSAISRVAAGLCFSFPHLQATEYIVGTGDGDLIMCSTSYSEQHLGIIQEAHTAPVCAITHSPFLEEFVLTCSQDWTTKLWKITSQDDCKLQLELCSVNLRSAVNDVAWSPIVSTVFALVANDGRIELWDLAHSVLDPREIIKPSAAEGSMNIKRMACLFSPDGSTLLTGSSSGRVDVMKLPPQLTKPQGDKRKEADRLKKILQSAVSEGNIQK